MYKKDSLIKNISQIMFNKRITIPLNISYSIQTDPVIVYRSKDSRQLIISNIGYI